jgi:hypothetical protein
MKVHCELWGIEYQRFWQVLRGNKNEPTSRAEQNICRMAIAQIVNIQEQIESEPIEPFQNECWPIELPVKKIK